MCETRKKFKKELKRWKHSHALSLGRKLVENLEDGNHANFWRKLNRDCSCETSEKGQCLRIGEATSVPEILLLWKEHFSKITNSHTECEIECQREIFEKELGTHRKSYCNFQCLNFSL